MNYYLDALNGNKVTYASYEAMPSLLVDLVPFQGNSVSAGWEYNEVGDCNEYVIRSYSTVIAKANNDGGRWVHSSRFSNTTSRIQNLLRRVWEV